MGDAAGSRPHSRKFVTGLLLLLALLLFGERLALGPYAPIRVSDTFESAFPYYQSYAAQMRSDGPSAWFPYDVSGRPSHA